MFTLSLQSCPNDNHVNVLVVTTLGKNFIPCYKMWCICQLLCHICDHCLVSCLIAIRSLTLSLHLISLWSYQQELTTKLLVVLFIYLFLMYFVVRMSSTLHNVVHFSFVILIFLLNLKTLFFISFFLFSSVPCLVLSCCLV
jgi:hypothetical protein